jgi:hypothetical protein
MKVYLSNYRAHWFSPYTILDKVVFWKDVDYNSLYAKKLVKVLTPITQAIKKVLDIVHPEISYVKIDKHDTWNMDTTLACIILPMLIQFKANKMGVPSEFTVTGGEGFNPQQHFDFYNTSQEYHDKAGLDWDTVLDKMIFAFEHIADDGWESKYYSDTFSCDHAALNKVHEQIQEGLELFGKYYRNLWD